MPTEAMTDLPRPQNQDTEQLPPQLAELIRSYKRELDDAKSILATSEDRLLHLIKSIAGMYQLSQDDSIDMERGVIVRKPAKAKVGAKG